MDGWLYGHIRIVTVHSMNFGQSITTKSYNLRVAKELRNYPEAFGKQNVVRW